MQPDFEMVKFFADHLFIFYIDLFIWQIVVTNQIQDFIFANIYIHIRNFILRFFKKFLNI